MRNLLAIFFISTLIFGYISPPKLNAQTPNDTIYQFSDDNTGLTYFIAFVKKSEHPAKVWMKTNIQTQWTEYKVVAEVKERITVSNGKATTHITYSHEKPKELLLYSSDFSKSWRYTRK